VRAPRATRMAARIAGSCPGILILIDAPLSPIAAPLRGTAFFQF
jgi:hypothetical protein